MILMFCGLSGAGKTTLAEKLKSYLEYKGKQVEIIDGDEVRQNLFQELGYSLEDRCSNMQRMAWIANKLSEHSVITIISAMNPCALTREKIKQQYQGVKEIFVTCSLDSLRLRDTKGLYRRAELPESDPNKIYNLSGVNGSFDPPNHPDLTINTDLLTVDQGIEMLVNEIL